MPRRRRHPPHWLDAKLIALIVLALVLVVTLFLLLRRANVGDTYQTIRDATHAQPAPRPGKP